jgi:hypothetical protein
MRIILELWYSSIFKTNRKFFIEIIYKEHRHFFVDYSSHYML